MTLNPFPLATGVPRNVRAEASRTLPLAASHLVCLRTWSLSMNQIVHLILQYYIISLSMQDQETLHTLLLKSSRHDYHSLIYLPSIFSRSTLSAACSCISPLSNNPHPPSPHLPLPYPNPTFPPSSLMINDLQPLALTATLSHPLSTPSNLQMICHITFLPAHPPF